MSKDTAVGRSGTDHTFDGQINRVSHHGAVATECKCTESWVEGNSSKVCQWGRNHVAFKPYFAQLELLSVWLVLGSRLSIATIVGYCNGVTTISNLDLMTSNAQ